MINLWRALHRPSMINWGLRDGTHLNVAPDGVLGMPCAPLGCGEQALRYGSNLRNLITLRTLQRLHRRVVVPVLHAEDVATLESPGRVRAIDAVGNVDPSPAKEKFKVVD
jgi:hypothetical protein